MALAASSWVGGDGFWDDPTNWSTGQVPTVDDDVTLNVSGLVTVTVRDARQVGTIAGAENLRVLGGAGQLSVGGTSTYSGVIDVTGTLALAGDLSGSGAVENRGVLRSLADATLSLDYTGEANAVIDVDAGRLTLVSGDHDAARFEVASGGVLQLSGDHDFRGDSVGVGAGRVEWTGSLDSADPRNRGSLDFAEGLLHWVSGTAGDLINDGFVQIDTDASLSINGAVTNNGSFVHESASTVTLTRHQEFINRGTYDFRDNGEFILSPGTSAVFTTIFHNLGTIRKSGGDGTSQIFSDRASTFLNNTGTADVRSGTLSLDINTLQIERQPFQGDFLHDGTYRVADNATLLLDPDRNIVNNFATIVLEGPNAAMPGIDTLAANAGVIRLEGGRDFTTIGDLTNGVDRVNAEMQNALVSGLNDQLGIAVDPTTGNVLLLSRDESIIREIDADGRTVRTIPRPTEPTSGSGISALTALDVVSAPVSIGGVTVPAGTLLMTYGDDAPPQVLALDRATGAELASVSFDDLPRGQPGLAHHPIRDTLFIMSSDNRLYEVDPSDGSLVTSFGLSGAGAPSPISSFVVGGVEVNETNGNLLVVVDRESIIRELTPTGEWVADYDLEHLGPRARNTVNNFSGIARDNATGDVWVLNREKRLWRFSTPERGVFGEIDLAAGSNLTVSGAFTQVAEAKTRVELAGRPTDMASGRLEIVGEATLAGELIVSTGAGFTPVAADQFTTVSFASRGGTEFGSITTPDGLTSRHTDGAVVVTVGDAPVGSPDLVVSAVTGPTTVTAGDEATIEWTVTNAGSVAASGSWRDAISLTGVTVEQVSDPAANPLDGSTVVDVVVEDSLLIEDVLVGDGAPLAPGESRTFSATVRVPARELGEYSWRVQTNARLDLVEESEDPELNAALSDQPVTLDVPVLTIDGPTIDATFATEAEPLWFRLDGTQDRDIEVTADLLTAGVTELYLGAGFLPTRFDYTHRHRQLGAADVSAVAPLVESDIPSAPATVWYVTVFPNDLPADGTPVQIAAERAAPSLTEVATSTVTRSSRQVLDVRGTNLSDDLSYRLVATGSGAAADSLSVIVNNAQRTFATFDMSSLPIGSYDLVVLDGGVEADRLPGGVTLVSPAPAAGPPELRYWLDIPEVMRNDRLSEISIHYHNEGSRTAALPWLTLAASDGTIHRSFDSSDVYGDGAITVLANGPTPGLTVLPPGASGRIDLYYRSPSDPAEIEFDLHASSIDDPLFANQSINWDLISNLQRPAGADEAAWDALVARNRAQYGETYANLHDFAVAEVQELVAAGYEEVLFYDGRVYFESVSRPTNPPTLRGAEDGEEPGVQLSTIAPESETAAMIGPIDVGGVPIAFATSGGDGIAEVHTVVIGPDFDAGLPGANDDAQSFARLVRTGANYAGPKPVLVDGRDSTPENALNAIRDAAANVDEDDTLFVYWASHGHCRFDNNETTVVDAERGIYRPSDVYFRLGGNDESRVDPAQINEVISGVRGRTAFIADTCYSGEVLSQIDADVRIGSARTRPVADDPSFGRFLQAELKKNPNGIGLVEASQKAADAYVANYLNGASRSGQEAIQGFVDATKGNNYAWPTDSTGNQVDSLSVHVQDTFFKAEGLSLVDEQARKRGARAASRAAVTIPVIDAGDRADEPVAGLSFKAKKPNKEDGSDKDDSLVGQTEGQLLAFEPVFEFRGDVRNSFDPNEKVGPGGVAGGFVRSGDDLAFTVFFENDPDKATLPAQTVTITDTLDEDLDLSTFELGDIFVGDVQIKVPAGRFAYSVTESLAIAGIDLVVSVEAELDFATRTVTWSFDSIDLDTGLPTLDALAGFLLVNDATRRGEGSVSYRVATPEGLVTGTQVTNSAEIVFDTNAPLITNTTVHTIDESAPISGPAVLAPTRTDTTFAVSWAGDDGAGSGVESFDVFVSTDGGDFELLLDDTTDTTTQFTGEVGKTYAFSTVASDAIGFREAKTPFAETATTVVVPTDGGEIRGVSYVDVNNNGQIEETELRLLGVQIELYRDGGLVATTFSDGDGQWRFTDLAAGTYTVVKVQPTLYFGGQETVGSLGAESVADNQFELAMAADDSAVDYLFAERGLLPWYIGRSMYLASTPGDVWEGVDLSVTDQWLELSPEMPEVTAWLGYDAGAGDAQVELYDDRMRLIDPNIATEDAASWIAPAGQTHYLRLSGSHRSVALALAFDRQTGDYNLDGLVDREDHAAWLSAYGATVAPNSGADGNGDGRIDAADYTVWRDASALQEEGTIPPNPLVSSPSESIGNAANEPQAATIAFSTAIPHMPESDLMRRRSLPIPRNASEVADLDRAFALLLLGSESSLANSPVWKRQPISDTEPIDVEPVDESADGIESSFSADRPLL
ncbi:hypothetical protein MalM25_28680 [Planctomycetes bacterium MalM25]|nr:hypothetical protein MalM25_28680 [Planctomycetes bacterium MalM25]